jgi:hypothetical protein
MSTKAPQFETVANSSYRRNLERCPGQNAQYADGVRRSFQLHRKGKSCAKIAAIQSASRLVVMRSLRPKSLASSWDIAALTIRGSNPGEILLEVNLLPQFLRL